MSRVFITGSADGLSAACKGLASSLFNSQITIGILWGYLIDFAFSRSEGWRWTNVRNGDSGAEPFDSHVIEPLQRVFEQKYLPLVSWREI